MAIREIITLGHPILRQKARKVPRFDPALRKLVADLFDTLASVEGAGLAAPQIAQPLRLFIVEYTDKESGRHYRIAMANPEIVEATGVQRGVDACLSIPGYYGVNIRRAARVVVKGQDAHGKPLRVSGEGFLAWALQHEIDHLDGILYLDRLERPEDLRAVRTDADVAEAAVAE